LQPAFVITKCSGELRLRHQLTSYTSLQIMDTEKDYCIVNKEPPVTTAPYSDSIEHDTKMFIKGNICFIFFSLLVAFILLAAFNALLPVSTFAAVDTRTVRA
jgi:hypothetical protein